MKEHEIKHLEFIQTTIARLASNSFLLKGWSVTLAAALFALAGKDSNPRFALVAFFPAFAFWVLDAYFLRQERLFRRLYDDVRTPSEGQKVEPFSLAVNQYTSQVPNWFQCMLAPSVSIIHGIVVLTIVVVVTLTRQTA
jgi:hypothetical protein